METKPKYINPQTDFGFKHLLGQKEIMLSFLNALFEKEGKVIKSVVFKDKEQTPEKQEDRIIAFDLYCQTEKKENLIIEMQFCSQATYRDRSLYYVSRSLDTGFTQFTASSS